jgi:protein-disulfide isomerase
MRRYLPFVIVIAVGLGAGTAGMMLFRAKKSQIVAAAPPSETKIKTDEGAIHYQGDLNAPVTLVEFGDFECPPCGRVAAATDRITAGYGNQLRMVFRHFPLAAHKHAIPAAQASEAADLQGKFWEMHGLLYQNQ